MGDLISRNRVLWFFIACFIGSIFLLGWLLLPFLAILVLGAVVAGLTYPVYSFINRHPKIRPSMASFVTCTLIFFLLFVPIGFFVSSLTQQAYWLYQKAQGAAINEQINTLLRETRVLEKANVLLKNFDVQLTGDEFKRTVSEAARYVGKIIFDQARAIAQNTLAFVVNFFLMMMVIFCLLLDGEKLVAYIVDLSPLPSDQEWILIDKFNEMAGAILIGNGLGGLIQGVFGGVAFWIYGFPAAFLWGVIMGLLAFLPIIGIGMVLIPTAIYLFINGNIGASIFFLAFYFTLSMGVEYIFKPKLVGHRMKMHPLLVFFSIVGGLKLFGILGIIYGPLIVTAFLTLAEIYRSSYQQLVENQNL